MTKYNDNHFTPSDHNAITRVKHIIEIPNKLKEKLRINTRDNNKFIPEDEMRSSRRGRPTLKEPLVPIDHPIVNLCESYMESVYFQLDSFPGTSGTLDFTSSKQGRIKKFIMYLDSSMNDNVTLNADLITGNLGRKSIVQFGTGGTPNVSNPYFKGTNNSTILEFNVNMQIFIGERIQITYRNLSASDVTVMAMADIKYGEEDFIK